jgi:hypothetical protein
MALPDVKLWLHSERKKLWAWVPSGSGLTGYASVTWLCLEVLC